MVTLGTHNPLLPAEGMKSELKETDHPEATKQDKWYKDEDSTKE